jgi:hypothetical protein
VRAETRRHSNNCPRLAACFRTLAEVFWSAATAISRLARTPQKAKEWLGVFRAERNEESAVAPPQRRGQWFESRLLGSPCYQALEHSPKTGTAAQLAIAQLRWRGRLLFHDSAASGCALTYHFHSRAARTARGSLARKRPKLHANRKRRATSAIIEVLAVPIAVAGPLALVTGVARRWNTCTLRGSRQVGGRCWSRLFTCCCQQPKYKRAEYPHNRFYHNCEGTQVGASHQHQSLPDKVRVCASLRMRAAQRACCTRKPTPANQYRIPRGQTAL